MQEQPLEQTVKTLVEHLERSEKRYERSQKHFRIMTLMFAIFMLGMVAFTIFRVDFVEKAEATGLISSLKMDMQNLNTILANMAELMKEVNSPEAKDAVSKIDDIINGTHNLLVEVHSEEDTIVRAISRAVQEMQEITDDMKGMTSDMSHMRGSMESMVQNFNTMTRDVHIMSVDMHRMSSTVTPTMGNMNNFMRFIPSP
ncbi:hypothetical protein [Candidatus Albibeggiatoa sp. nov. NOAA]|uniref:hypothetical protein n=1 Tax=Candidatus Albibeggiatoa sp. nov. NOAA TaxID=3162724 RepID=UPI0032F5E9F8|nr:hypothetical protein [Thiotrichaceae bacterium]